MTTFESPLEFDNDTLLFWVEYMLGPKNPRVDAYDELAVDVPEYGELSRNTSMLEHIKTVLMLDVECEAHMKLIRETRQRNFFAGRLTVMYPQIRRYREELAEIDTRRKAAYEAYEMFRKLTVSSETPDLYRITLR